MSEATRRSLKEIEFGANQPIALQGDVPRYLGILRKGRVDVLLAPERAGEASLEDAVREGVVVDSLEEEGTLVGEVGAVLGKNYATLLARTPTTLELIPVSHASLDKSILGMPSLGLTIGRSMAARLSKKTTRLRQRGGVLSEMRKKVDDYSLKFYQVCEQLMRQHGVLRPVAEACRQAVLTDTFRRGQKLSRQQQADFGSLASLTSARRGRLISVQAGSTLWAEGAAANELYIVLRGLFEVIVEGRVIEYIRPGEVVGEMAILLGRTSRRTATVRAHVFSQVAAIPADKFESLISKHPILILHIAKVLARRIMNADCVIGQYDKLVSEALRQLCSQGSSCAEDLRRLIEGLKTVQEKLVSECRELESVYDGVMKDYKEYAAKVSESVRAEGEEASAASRARQEAEYRAALIGLGQIFQLLAEGKADREHLMAEKLSALAQRLASTSPVSAEYVLSQPHPQSLTSHSVNTCALAVEVAKEMGLQGKELEMIAAGALVHDVGMLATAGSGSDEEHAQLHISTYAEEKLALLPDLPEEVKRAVGEHHECWDGSGYPKGLKGEEISLVARVVAAANDFDILVMKGTDARGAVDVLEAQSARYWPDAWNGMLKVSRRALGAKEKARLG